MTSVQLALAVAALHDRALRGIGEESFDMTVKREAKSIDQRQREIAEQRNNCTATEGRFAVQEQYKRNVQLDRDRKEAARLKKAGDL